MLMQAEAGDAFSPGRSEVLLSHDPPIQSYWDCAFIHVHAGSAGGSGFSYFLRGRSEISSLSPALPRQPVAPLACHPLSPWDCPVSLSPMLAMSVEPGGSGVCPLTL